MKNIFTALVFILASHLANGQACGIYRIKYVGAFNSDNYTVIAVQLPTTMYLHGEEKERSKYSFVSTKVTDGKFEFELSSHLTNPYSDAAALLAFYKSLSPSLKIRVTVSNNESRKKMILNVNWDDLVVSVIRDGKFGTLFEFKFKDIII